MTENIPSLVLPITKYLNQKIVFDLLAVIEDGFVQVTNLNISSSKDQRTSGSVEAESGFGLYGVKTKIKAAFAKQSNNTDEKSSNEERVHTPTSLFSKLVSYLEENSLIVDINNKNDLSNLKTGSFVRFDSRLEKNPLISLLESLEQMGVLAIRMQTKGKKGKGNDDDSMLKEIKTMKKSLTENHTSDLICTINEKDNLKTVIPVYLEYFVHNNMSEIIDGNYSVVGKVIKIVKDQEDNINLFRNTGFKLFKQEALEELFDQMSNYNDEQIEFPDIESKVSSPSLLVLPIAIYS